MRVGRLTKAHGLKGAIKVELYTDDPDRRFTPGARFTLQVPTSSPWHGKTLELRELRWYNSHPVAFFQDVPDRSTAESLIKAILWIDHDDSEQSPEEDAWYDHQLVGLAVHRDGVRVGTIARVDHLPAQDLLAVRTPDAEVLVPFVKAIVTSVDLEAGVVTVDPPTGLFEALPEDDLPTTELTADGSATDGGVADGPSTEDDGISDDAAEETDMTNAEATSPEASGPTDADLVEKLPDEASDALMEDASADPEDGPVDDSLTRAQSEVQIAEGESAGAGPDGEADAAASESEEDGSEEDASDREQSDRETPA